MSADHSKGNPISPEFMEEMFSMKNDDDIVNVLNVKIHGIKM